MQEQITAIINTLNQGKTILYPTDTVWGLGCDATNESAVTKVYELKNRTQSKSLIVLVSNIEMLLEYVNTIPDTIQEYIKTIKTPTTIIYNNPKGIARNAIAVDNTIAVRVVHNGFAHKLIKKFGKPIISTSANISGKNTPKSFDEIAIELKMKIDFVVDSKLEDSNSKPSKIIRFDDEKIIFIRK